MKHPSFSLKVIAAAFTIGIFLVSADTVSAAGRVFYDGFESGNTNQWWQVDNRDKCQAVQSPGDGGAGPQSGSWQARCNYNGTAVWNEPHRYETLGLSPSVGNEFFLRKYIRVSSNLESTGALGDNTGPKLMRFLNGAGYSGYLGLEDVNPGSSPAEMSWIHEAPGGSYTSYNIAQISRTGWTKFELYINKTTDQHRVWVNDVLVRDFSGDDLSAFDGVFTIDSNWSGVDGTRIHDATNYLFFDEVEIYTDSGSGSTGSMSSGTIAAGGGGDTTAPAVPMGLTVQ